MKLIVDRIVEKIVILELPDRTTADAPLGIFPPEISEGDVVEITLSKEETKERQNDIEKRFKNLFDE